MLDLIFSSFSLSRSSSEDNTITVPTFTWFSIGTFHKCEIVPHYGHPSMDILSTSLTEKSRFPWTPYFYCMRGSTYSRFLTRDFGVSFLCTFLCRFFRFLSIICNLKSSDNFSDSGSRNSHLNRSAGFLQYWNMSIW